MFDIQLAIKYFLFFVEQFYVIFIKLVPTYVECLFEFFNLYQKSPKSIRNKVILITGGGQGIGKEMAIQLARYDNQCKIVIADINLTAAKETVNYLRINMYTKAYAFFVDVSDYDSVVDLHKNITTSIGVVDILINNAGLITFLSLMEKEWTDMEKIIDVNFKSHFWMTRVFLIDMIAQKSGHIIGISSLSGRVPGPYRIVYSATKAGLDSFMKCLSTELLCDGHSDYIKTSLVSPYFISTRPEIQNEVSQLLNFPALKPLDAANTIVDGILRDMDEIYVPKMFSLLKLVTFLPFKAYKKLIKHHKDNMPFKLNFRNNVPY